MSIRSGFSVALLLGSALQAIPVTAQVVADDEETRGWRVLGSFSGSPTEGFGQAIGGLLHEAESDGDLYRDLGALSIGLGIDLDDRAEADWDNYFTRRVYPLHEELPPGADLTAEDVSRYMDLQTLVSRKRLRYDYVPDIVKDVGVGIVVEGGVSVSLGRGRPPLELGNRPLEEALADRDDETFRAITRELEDRPEDILSLGAKGVRATAQWIADGLGRRADTEHARLFWESYADPATLGLDAGLPVKADLFASDDARLAPGDRIRHLKFVGISPISANLREHGFEAQFENFYRYLRETTVIEEEGGTVLVNVRVVARGGLQFVPLKIRPELKLLGLVTLGHTVFEQRWNRSRLASFELAYRVDLNRPKGRAALEALLGDGDVVSLRPLAVAAVESEGVTLLDSEHRAGSAQQAIRRLDVSSPLRYSNRKTTSLQRIELNGGDYRELTVARSRDLRKSWGRDEHRRHSFLAQAVAELPSPDLPSSVSSQAVGVSLLTTVEDRKASPEEVWRVADLLALLGGRHPALDAFSDVPAGSPVRAFANVELTFGQHHLRRLRSLPEDEVWGALAEILLGERFHEEWASAASRSMWRKRWVRRDFARDEAPELGRRPNPTRGALSVHGRFELARRAVRLFRKMQDFLVDGDCFACVRRAAGKWADVATLQILLYRLAESSDGPAPGFSYDVFNERMLRVATVSNGVVYDDSGLFVGADSEGSRERRTAEDVERGVLRDTVDWTGRKNFLDRPEDRLRAGFVYERREAAPTPDDPCWKLRLYTDHRVAPELQLRIDLREARDLRSDRFLSTTISELESPRAMIETPFMTASYYYELALPQLAALPPDRPYTLLLRIINPDGLPVTEEQQIFFRFPEGGEEAPACTAQVDVS